MQLSRESVETEEIVSTQQTAYLYKPKSRLNFKRRQLSSLPEQHQLQTPKSRNRPAPDLGEDSRVSRTTKHYDTVKK